MSPERGTRLCALVQPDHPMVRTLWSTWTPEGRGAWAILSGVRSMVAGFGYRGTPGSSADLGEVVARRSGNCLDLSTLVVSVLRAAGMTTAYVLIGSGEGMFPASVHAWAIVTVEATPFALDPADRGRHLSDARDLLARVRPVALFNDLQCVRGAAGVQRAVLRTEDTNPGEMS